MGFRSNECGLRNWNRSGREPRRLATGVLLSALVDTGADLSVVPRGLPARLNLPPVGRLGVAGIDAIPRPLTVYAAEVAIDGYQTTIRIGATPLIGRDLLNKITVHLHGQRRH